RGVAVAALLARPSENRPLYRRYLDRVCDRAGGCSGVPHVFDLSQLRELLRFLRPGNFLFVTVEGRHGRHVLLRQDAVDFAITTGVLRWAAKTNAVFVPCLIAAEPHLGFTVHAGDAVPPQLVTDKSRHQEACEYLLRSFLPLLHSRPEQCSWELLWSIYRN